MSGETKHSSVSAALTWTFVDVRAALKTPKSLESEEGLSFGDLGFSHGTQKWNILASTHSRYPEKKEGDPNKMGFYLRLTGGSVEKIMVRALLFKIFIPRTETWKSIGGPYEPEFDGEVSDNSWGAPKAVSHDDLLAEPSQYLCNGAMTVRVDFSFEVASNQDHFSAHRARLAQLFNTEEFSDFTLISSDKEEFRVHRSILAVHSSVFRGMLKDGTLEQQTGRADIPDVDGETLEVLLKYIYSGDLTKVAQIAEKVLEGADKYDIIDLRNLAVKLLSVNLTVYNALRMMDIADQRGLPELNKTTVEFILKHLEIFRQTKGYQELKVKNSLLYNFIDAAAEKIQTPYGKC